MPYFTTTQSARDGAWRVELHDRIGWLHFDTHHADASSTVVLALSQPEAADLLEACRQLLELYRADNAERAARGAQASSTGEATE
jgi:hypothetical protein